MANGPKYIKLHGSWEWRRPDGSPDLVLGGDKYERIKANPLFSYYQEAFETFLWSGDKRLCIVGYGFGDEHINRVLLKGVLDHGLRIHIWDTMPPDAMQSKLAAGDVWMKRPLPTPVGLENLWNALCGYTNSDFGGVAEDAARFAEWAAESLA